MSQYRTRRGDLVCLKKTSDKYLLIVIKFVPNSAEVEEQTTLCLQREDLEGLSMALSS
jgi:hypothetical protein